MEDRIHVWTAHFSDRRFIQLQWVDPTTRKKRTVSARTECPRKAEERRTDLEADLNAGRHGEPSRLSWRDFRARFEAEHVAPLRANTRAGYADALDALEELCRPATLRGVGEATVSAYAAALRSRRDNQPSTVKTRLQYLHAVLSWAARQKLIPATPAFPVVKVPRTRPQAVGAELWERLAARCADPQLLAFVACGWYAGMRRTEAYHVEWEQTDAAPWLDPARRRIHFPAAFVKGAEDQWVPLDPELWQLLEPLRLQTPYELPTNGRRVFHFNDPRTGRPVDAPAVGARVAALARSAGVRLSMRTLRRGFGCRYAGKVPAQVLQRLMRHSDISLTVRYYVNCEMAMEEAVFGNSQGNTRPESAENRQES